jgi:hypothetical protein
MPVDIKHPQFTAYSEAWDAAAERSSSPIKNLAYNDYRAADAAKAAESGNFDQAIRILDEIGNMKYENKHAGHIEHIKRFRITTPCTSFHAKIGGGCFNCGWNP